MTLHFDLKGWDQWLSAVDLMPVLKRGIHSGAMRAQKLMHDKTVLAEAFNTGAFARGWKSTKMEWGSVLYNSQPYSPVIESGARYTNKMPPTKPLAKWAQRKLGVSRDQAEGIAFVLARAIKKRGLPARNVLKDALPEIKTLVLKEIGHEMNRFFGGGP